MAAVMDEEDLKKSDEVAQEAEKAVEESTEKLHKQALELEQKLNKGIRFSCSIHGDLNKGATVIPYEENGKTVRRFYCNKCICNIFEDLIKQGKMGITQIGVSKSLLNDLGVTEEDLKNFVEKDKATESSEKAN